MATLRQVDALLQTENTLLKVLLLLENLKKNRKEFPALEKMWNFLFKNPGKMQRVLEKLNIPTLNLLLSIICSIPETGQLSGD